jgi:hypothetical protein
MTADPTADPETVPAKGERRETLALAKRNWMAFVFLIERIALYEVTRPRS